MKSLGSIPVALLLASSQPSRDAVRRRPAAPPTVRASSSGIVAGLIAATLAVATLLTFAPV